VLYTLILRLFFVRFKPESIHHFVVAGVRFASAIGFLRLLRLSEKSTKVIEAFGLRFNGPFGLAAGFDKNAIAIKALGELGFSHVEVGTVTALAQPGNPKPRLFRLLADRALINRMGFNNEGAYAVAKRLAKLREKNLKHLPVIGINIGKSKVTPVEEAAEDYRTSARLLSPYADYLAVNVSSPNTPGLRSLQSVEALEPILTAVLAEAGQKPVLVKIAPDLANEDILAVADLAKRLKLAGVIATNTTISRANLKTDATKVAAMGDGGLSGAPLKDRAIEVLELLKAHLGDSLAIVSVGGVESPEEAQERMKAGATLVQGYTGFIYRGPFWARRINRFVR
jgi:dihydroorotate dehydrogenase